jgi:hypothetical protein
MMSFLHLRSSPSSPGNIPLTTSMFLSNPSGAVRQYGQYAGRTSYDSTIASAFLAIPESLAGGVPQYKSIFPFSLSSAVST